MQVLQTDGVTACCIAGGAIRREVSLFLMPPGSVAAGDFVIVHVGYAIQKLVASEARTTWQLLDELRDEIPGCETPVQDA